MANTPCSLIGAASRATRAALHWLGSATGRAGGVCLALLLFATPAQGDEPDARAKAWQALAEGGHVALMRHALAPGIGDPSAFRLGDCSTQRNLSAAGRRQAREMGERFRARGIEVAAVHASRWCRTLETARLLDLGEVVPTPALDSFFRDRGEANHRTRAARQLVRDWPGKDTLILVTHQVNISALVGGGVASGEMIVVKPSDDGLVPVGRIR